MTNEEAVKIVTEWRDRVGYRVWEAFGMAIEALEAKEEKEKDQIHVGDVLLSPCGNVEVVVTWIEGNDFSGVAVSTEDTDYAKIGHTYSGQSIQDWHKTGRHFPQIAEVLKKMEAGE